MLSNVSRANGDEILQIFYLGYKFKWMISRLVQNERNSASI